MEIILRNDARALGLSKYFTGEPCIRGHVAIRYTRNALCFECRREDCGYKGMQAKPRGPSEAALRKQAYVEALPVETRSRLIPRKDAVAKGLKRYFTGVPCPKGHQSERLVNGAECLECHKLTRLKNIKRNPASNTARQKRYYRKNCKRICQEQNDRYAGRSEEWKTVQHKYQKEWRKKRREANGGYKPWKPVTVLNCDELDQMRAWNCCKSSVRRGARLPDGVTIKEIIAQTLHLFKLKRELETETGVRHHIDHIIPIMAGGGHEPGNLQVLSAPEHKRKTYEDNERYRYKRGRASAA